MNFSRFGIPLIMVFAGGALAQDESPSRAIPMQEVGLADAQVQSSQPLALRLPAETIDRLRASLDELTHAESGEAQSARTTASIQLLWETPDRKVRMIPVRDSAVSLPITPHTSGAYLYHLELRDPGGRYSVRLPAGDRRYRIEVAGDGGPTILNGPGDQDAVFGETIPVALTVADPASIRAVTLMHRVRHHSGWTKTPMTAGEADGRRGSWEATLSRPLGEGIVIEYYVLVADSAGRVTLYGSPEKPHRLRVLAPLAPVDVGQ